MRSAARTAAVFLDACVWSVLAPLRVLNTSGNKGPGPTSLVPPDRLAGAGSGCAKQLSGW